MTPRVGRVAQLTQKTNQFNLTTRRYSEQEIADMAADARWRVDALTASDRFGDYGLVGWQLPIATANLRDRQLPVKLPRNRTLGGDRATLLYRARGGVRRYANG